MGSDTKSTDLTTKRYGLHNAHAAYTSTAAHSLLLRNMDFLELLIVFYTFNIFFAVQTQRQFQKVLQKRAYIASHTLISYRLNDTKIPFMLSFSENCAASGSVYIFPAEE